MKFKKRSLNELGKMVVGDIETFRYRSSQYITEFFEDCDTDYQHDGSTRARWAAERLADIISEPETQPGLPSATFQNLIRNLMDLSDADLDHDDENRTMALQKLNTTLARENLEAFYAEDKLCYLRHNKTKIVARTLSNPHRPLSAAEITKQNNLVQYLDRASEDDFIENILLPLFRHLGFVRITPAGHKDKALEYGKDIWMKFRLPTLHMLYFGIQAKKGKLDAAGKSRNVNVSEILNQVQMMLGHTIFDPEINKRRLVDHAMIVTAGEITKQARNWLGERLDATQRSQIIFMDRQDVVNLYITSSIPLPYDAQDEKQPTYINPADIPF